jgi:arylsulfatase A-like enzyme
MGSPSSTPLNVLLITADQMRRDHLGCYGNAVIRTPNLDALAASGTRLDRAYVSNPVCMPNRSTLATGRLPRNHGCWSNGIALPPHERTIADVLAECGYHTALLGKGHLTPFGAAADAPPPNYESFRAWQAGRMTPDWHGPYYGFQECRLAIGHGPYGFRHGHYGQWLRESFPDAAGGFEQPTPSPTGALQCFTPQIPVEAHCSSWLGLIGSEYLRQRAADGRPFLCWLSFPDPHHPFCPPEPYATMHDPAEVVMPRLGAEALDDKPPQFREAYEGGRLWEGINRDDVLREVAEPQLREILSRTYGMISLIDANVGKVLATLAETHLAERTVVVFTSDHGDLMGDCGLIFKGPFLLEGLIAVPMIWRVPGDAAGAAADGLFSSVDVAPTILRLLGLDPPRWMDSAGQDELVRGRAGERDAAFVEFKSMYRPELDLRTVVTADRKLTYYAGLDAGELYDMTADVPEGRNLYRDRAWAAERLRLEKRLLDETILSRDERLWPSCHA